MAALFRLIASRRFNFVDLFAIYTFASLWVAGQYVLAAIILVAGTFVGMVFEKLASRSEEAKLPSALSSDGGE